MIVSAAAAFAASRSRCFVTTVSPALVQDTTGGENSTTTPGIPIVRFKVALDGQRYDVSSPVNEKLSTVLAKHRVLVETGEPSDGARIVRREDVRHERTEQNHEDVNEVVT